MERTAEKSAQVGTLLCLLSGAGFGTLAVLGKAAHALGFNIPSTLAWRFLGACFFLWIWLLRRGSWRLSKRDALACFLLGAVGYSGQAALFFGSLHRVGAALTDLLLYLYPSLVTLLEWFVRGRRPDRFRILALLLSLAGCFLTAQTSSASFDSAGIAMGVGSAIWYACYLTFGASMVSHISPHVVSGYVCAGAGLAFFFGSLWQGEFVLPADEKGWAVVLGLSLVATVLPVLFLFEGIKRIGASKASILSSIELVVALALAFGLLRESFSPRQLLGAFFILTAVFVVQQRQGPEAPRPTA
jgi:drug/metabolite transporter (DMT)-like permease